MKFVVFSRKPVFGRRQWYFRIVAKNGKIVAQSEGYFNKDDCIKTLQAIRANARTAVLEMQE